MTKPLGLYLHIPFCRSRCAYCDFYSISRTPDTRFSEALIREIEMKSAGFKDRVCDTIYFGGGTPSTLTGMQLSEIMEALYKNFHISDQAEITMEMNPCDMTEEYLANARRLGINRLSVGVQTHNDYLLKAIDRRHDSKAAEEAVKRAYRLGFHNISIDLMYELPGQTPLDFEKSLKWAVHLPINHLSVYSLIIENGTKFGQMAERGILKRPTEEESWEMYQMMCRILPHYGLERYEISSFARKGYRSRHNLKYWDLSHYLGLGPAACSRIGHARKENNPGVRLYEKEVLSGNLPPEEVENLSVKDEMEEYCFLHLRTREGIPLQDFEERYGFPIEHWFGREIAMLKERKLLKESLGHLFMTYHGAALGNFVFEQFIIDE